MRCIAALLALPSAMLASWSLPAMAQDPSAPASDFETLRNQTAAAAQSKDYKNAARLTREMVKVAPDAPARAYTMYNLACLEALQKRHREALEALAEAVEMGFAEWQDASSDENLRPLRGMPEFKRLIVIMKDLAVRLRVFEVTRWDNPDLGWASLHRFDEPHHPKLAQLRDEYRLGAEESPHI